MDRIYIFAVLTQMRSYLNRSEPCGDTVGVAVDKDLNIITNHISSGIKWTKHDMGINSDFKHDIYKEKYPDGYELVWLDCFCSIDEAFIKIKNIN